ncbi:facilitated trehalose transporter Tret1 isoform X3 [Bemisia tabaci]|uniref:facilitated trehalose transporter Tret1 isoform X3 n=1 Tax=Bemisia tabaci TaxID=7038 RepID=UPI003B27D393
MTDSDIHSDRIGYSRVPSSDIDKDAEKSHIEAETDGSTGRKISRFRSALPQVLSVTAKNFILLDLGMTLAFSTIVVPVLLNNKDPRGLSFNESQATWFGSGFMDAPVLTYVGEICEPSLRGILISYSLQFCSAGFFLQCLLGSVTTWRNVAFISLFFPATAFLCISQIPETPMWLLSKGRTRDAEKALCWLRGWVSPEDVAEEFSRLVEASNNAQYRHQTETKKTEANSHQGNTQSIVTCPSSRPPVPDPLVELHSPKLSFREKARDLLRPEILRPMLVIMTMNFFYLGSGFPAFKTYMVLLFQRIRVPMNANWASVCVSSAIIIGHLVLMLAVKWLGKRRIALISIFCVAFFDLAIAVHVNFQTAIEDAFGASANWFLFSYFIILTLTVSFGLGPVPWMLMSEIFPFRGRSFASGICAALYYITSSLIAKTFLSILNLLGVPGSYCLFGTVGMLGFIYAYLYLPETEGKTLEDIEDIYKHSHRQRR